MRRCHQQTTRRRYLLGSIVVVLRLVVGTSLSSPAWKSSSLSRSDFTSHVANVASVALLLPISSSSARGEVNEDILEFPLQFLPHSGCWGLPTTLSLLNAHGEDEESFSYLAVVDTGSPFLTAPGPARAVSRSMIRNQNAFPDTSMEQYGASKGDIEWRQADVATWILGNGVAEVYNMTLGVVSPQLIRETGGIFCGLIQRDDHRLTWMQQVGSHYSNLRLNLATTKPSLLLSSRSLAPQPTRNEIGLFDLFRYGPDLHHYAVLASSVVVEWQGGGSMTIDRLQRKIVIVLDTGLTGCIFHDSLATELEKKFGTDTVKGIQVNVRTDSGSTLTLASNPDYWRLDCFHLPWFYEDQTDTREDNTPSRAPHIIAVGATIWTGVKSLTIDTISRRAIIDLKKV